MTETEQQQVPLGWSQTGNPIELPPEAVFWRIRRLNGSSKGGAPEIVYGVDGTPLTVSIQADPEEFAEAVDGRAGKYRLDALDESRTAITGAVPAYHLVGGSRPRVERGPQESVQSLEVVERMARTMADALKDALRQLSTVVAASANLVSVADGAGITRRKPTPQELVPVSPAVPAVVEAEAQEEDDSEPEPPWWQPFVVELTPVVAQLVPLMVSRFAQQPKAEPSVPQGATPAPPDDAQARGTDGETS